METKRECEVKVEAEAGVDGGLRRADGRLMRGLMGRGLRCPCEPKHEEAGGHIAYRG